jgi:hypothetical protein
VRVDGVVRGDHQELRDFVAERNVGDRVGAEDVVADDRDGIGFHQRDVLESGGVKNAGGAVVVEDFIEKRFVRDVSEDRNVRRRRVECGECCVDFVEILLGMIEEEKAGCGTGRQNAFGQCGADAAAGAGNQNRVTRQ